MTRFHILPRHDRETAAARIAAAARRRGAAIAAAMLVIMTLASGPGLAHASPAGAATRGDGSCPRAVLYLVPGSAQGNSQTYLGRISRSAAGHLIADLMPAQVKVVTVRYPAVPVWEAVDNAGGVGFTYLASLAAGVGALGTLIAAQVASLGCRGTAIAIVGEDQGADVIGQYLNSGLSLATTRRIAGVAMISDPRFNPLDSSVDAGSFHHGLPSLFAAFPAWTSPTSRAFLGGVPRSVPLAFRSKTLSACNALDPVCNYNLAAGAICFGFTTWPSDAAAIAAGASVLIPFASPWCPGVGYPRPESPVITVGHRVTTAGIGAYLAGKIMP